MSGRAVWTACTVLLVSLLALTSRGATRRASPKPPSPLNTLVSTMMAVGPGSEERYESALSAFLSSENPGQQLTSSFDALPDNALGSKWSLLYLASKTPVPESVSLLERVALSAPRFVHPSKGEGGDVTYTNRLTSAIGVVQLYLAGQPDAAPSMTRLLKDAEPELARMMALELFSANRLTKDEQQLLLSRGVDARFRKATEAEFEALVSVDPEHTRHLDDGQVTRAETYGPAPSINSVQATLLPVDPPPPPPPPPAQPSGACGRAATSEFDSFYAPLWGCSQSEINDMWGKYHFDNDDWDEGLGYDDPCNENLPLKRTFNALQLLKYGITASPTCDTTSANVGQWAYCWAGDSIDELDGTCDDDARAWTTWAPFVDHRTELEVPFFYDETVVQRAATVFHEARHAQGWCVHSDSCVDGEGSCDPNWAHGCVGIGSVGGKGANAYTVLYMTWFLRAARSSWTSEPLRDFAVGEANRYLAQRFGSDPCFRVNPDGTYAYLPCYFGF